MCMDVKIIKKRDYVINLINKNNKIRNKKTKY